MLRDDNIAKIKSCLDQIAKDESKKFEYDTIMTLANNTMNVNIHIGEDGLHHEVLWYNRKIPNSFSFDEDLQKLVDYIDRLIPPAPND